MSTPRRDRPPATYEISAFEVLVEAAPDAIIVVDPAGSIREVNPCAVELFGYERDELIGMTVEQLVPGDLRGLHEEHRHAYQEDPASRPMGAGRDLFMLRADGELIPVDIGLTPVDLPGGPATAAFVRDATERRAVEAQRRRISESAVRRRQALELNDNVVQGLVSLLWRLDQDDLSGAHEIAQTTLRSARRMMADLLRDLDETIEPGALVRESPTTTGAPTPPTDPVPPSDGHIRVLIADDAPDLRTLLRLRLSQEPSVVVVGEAADGQEAVELAGRHHPDVVLLDLGMPRVDGLQAAARILAERPDCRVVVLSGYPEESLRDQALAVGAVEYLEKESDLSGVIAAVRRHGETLARRA